MPLLLLPPLPPLPLPPLPPPLLLPPPPLLLLPPLPLPPLLTLHTLPSSCVRCHSGAACTHGWCPVREAETNDQ